MERATRGEIQQSTPSVSDRTSNGDRARRVLRRTLGPFVGVVGAAEVVEASLMPHTISDCPRRASPAANTPGTDVV
jgi:hypothetical protein